MAGSTREVNVRPDVHNDTPVWRADALGRQLRQSHNPHDPKWS